MITFTETSYREYKIPIGDEVLTVNEVGYQAIQYLLKQAKREALESAIHVVETYRVSVGNSAAGERAAEWTMENLKEIRDDLRRMAEEIK